MNEERTNQTKRALFQKLVATYQARLSEDGNGHRMERWIERHAELGDTFVLSVRGPTGMLVGMSRTPEPDPDTEREFRVDFLMEEKR